MLRQQHVIHQLLLGFVFLWAANLRADQLLFFPLDQSKIQILPQRFEYDLMSKDKFRLGNTILDSEKIDFQISSYGKNDYTLKFHWPASLLKKGEIVIKDNAGKAIWKHNLDSVKITKSSEVNIDGIKLVTDSAYFETTAFDESTLAQLRLLPFFRFCVHSEEALTRMYLCSKDLYFKRVGKRVVIKSRDSLHQDSFVQINGQVVGSQGMIFLQSTNDALSLKATLASGASIELDTRLKAVDFVDAYQTGEKKMVVKAKGAEPANEEQVLARSQDGSADQWTAELNLDRPVLYLRGEGDIPMRQEFVIKSKLRSDSLQIPTVSEAEGGTYSKSATIQLTVPADTTLQSADKKSIVTKRSSGKEKNIWTWDLTDLEVGKVTRRFITVEAPEGQLMGSAELYRAYRNEVFLGLGITRSVFDFRFQQAIDKSWAWDLSYRSFLDTVVVEPSFSILSAKLDYRLTKGLYLKTPSHGVTLSYDQFVSDAFNLGAVSVGGYLTYAAPEKWSKVYDWTVLRLNLPLLGSAKGYTISTSGSAELVMKKLEGQWSWEMGTRYESYTFNNPANNSVVFTRWSLIAGISTLF